jgi:hypothetical protein
VVNCSITLKIYYVYFGNKKLSLFIFSPKVQNPSVMNIKVLTPVFTSPKLTNNTATINLKPYDAAEYGGRF